MPTPIKQLSAMPKGLDANIAQPTGERILAWATTRKKYCIEIWRTHTGYELWERKVFRAHQVKGAGRPEWFKHATYSNLAKAFLASQPLRQNITFGGKPRLMTIIYVHPNVYKLMEQQ